MGMVDEYNLFPTDCFVVEGYNRSAIYDLSRSRIVPIPTSLTPYLRSKAKFNKLIAAPQNTIEQEYKEFLFSNEFVLCIPHSQKNSFKPISTEWITPFDILIVQIEIETSVEFLEEVLIELRTINIYKLQLSILNPTASLIDQVAQLISGMDYNEIQILINDVSFEDGIEALSCKFPTIDFAIFEMNTSNTEFYQPNFTIGYSVFFESKEYNIGLNRTIKLDANGNVLLPYRATNLNIKSNSLNQILHAYKELWKAHKSKISVCNVCEFRKACIDKRYPHSLVNSDYYYYEMECAYNPFISKFSHEPKFRSLVEIGLHHNEIDYETSKAQIELANEEVWNN